MNTDQTKRGSCWRRYFPVAVWLTLIFVVSSIPNFGPPPLFRFSDKVIHVFEYAALGFLLFRALSGADPGPQAPAFRHRALRMSVFLGLGVGLLDELHQLFIPGRSCDWTDLLGDVLGVGLGAYALYRWQGRSAESACSPD
jgi:VanZ family protein